jgi:hypothetical protein
MKICLDVGAAQLKKAGEELCGDSIENVTSEEANIIILSDGLGSGVKASILSKLTTRTASTMLQKGSEIDEVIETLAHTLPTCKSRNLAYSTFSILQVFPNGKAYLAEYDNPAAFLGRGPHLRQIQRSERQIDQKVIKEAYFDLREGDWAVLVSDGVLHAGIGGVWNFGWGWERMAKHLTETCTRDIDAHEWADSIARLCGHLYGGKPGDDASIVAVKVRQPRHLTVLIGPPRNRADDPKVVDKLLKSRGKKIVCGGSTGNMVGRLTGKGVQVDLGSNDVKVPPMGIIKGIDLVTEGILTMVYTLENLRGSTKARELAARKDGASKLAALFLEADSIHFIVGTTVNPAQQGPDIPTIFAYKQQIISDVIKNLREKGKTITEEYY